MNASDGGYRVTLKAAIENRHINCIEILISFGVDVNHSVGYWTTVWGAVKFFGDNIKVLQLLIQSGADVNKVATFNPTPLEYACTQGFVAASNALLQAGVDVNVNVEDGKGPLILASTNGREEVVDLLIKFTNDKNMTLLGADVALIKASSRGYINIVKAIVELGADVNSVACSKTALAGASGNGHAGIIKFLVEAGADVEAKLKDGDTALGIAVRNGQFKCVEVLLNAGADVNSAACSKMALAGAAENGHAKIVKILVESGADVKTKLKDGDTALGIAVRNGQFKCVEVLLNAGADVNHRDKYGWPILMSAASEGHVRCINYISSMQKACIFDRIPLLESIGNHADRVSFLKDKRPWMKRHIEAKNKDLFEEINDFLYVKEKDDKPTEYYTNCVKLLKEKGSEVNTATNSWTPLMVASLNGIKNIVKFLLESGADVNKTSETGWTPLLTAVVGDQCDCAGILVKAGADVNVEVPSRCAALNYKKNALGFAVDIGNSKMVKLLLLSGAHLLGLKMAYPEDRKIARLLIAAGYSNSKRGNIFLRPKKSSPAKSLLLSDLCRAVIRRRLSELNSPVNLVHLVAKLGLPSLLQKYLLFGSVVKVT